MWVKSELSNPYHAVTCLMCHTLWYTWKWLAIRGDYLIFKFKFARGTRQIFVQDKTIRTCQLELANPKTTKSNKNHKKPNFILIILLIQINLLFIGVGFIYNFAHGYMITSQLTMTLWMESLYINYCNKKKKKTPTFNEVAIHSTGNKTIYCSSLV